MRNATKNIIALTVLLGVGSFLALYSADPRVSGADLDAALAFAVFSIFGALMPYALSDRVNGQATFVTFIASVVLVPSWLSVASGVGVILLAQLIARKEYPKIIFNVAQHAVTLSLTVVAYLATGAVGAVSGNDVSPLSVVVAFLVFVGANSVLVAAILCSEMRRSFWSVWRETQRAFFFDLLAVPFVFVFVLLYVKLGVLATSAAAALILIVRQLNSTNEVLQRSNKELLELTVTTLEARDPYTSGHSRRVSHYSRMMGHALSLSDKQIERLAASALLHDVGKIYEIFAPILVKPGKLTSEERAIMESHPAKGAELVRISSYLRDTVEPIRHHHEAWDGSGYPDALSGESIPILSRIIAIADTIDAMASDRPYRRGLIAEKIRAEVVRMSGIQFDPIMLKTLIASGTIDTVLRLACESHPDNVTAVEPAMALIASR